MTSSRDGEGEGRAETSQQGFEGHSGDGVETEGAAHNGFGGGGRSCRDSLD